MRILQTSGSEKPKSQWNVTKHTDFYTKGVITNTLHYKLNSNNYFLYLFGKVSYNIGFTISTQNTCRSWKHFRKVKCGIYCELRQSMQK